MSNLPDGQTLTDKLQLFGLGNDDAQVYLFLLAGGPTPALEISRSLDIPRTNIYRSADRLVARQLAHYTEGRRGKELAALGPRALEQFIANQQAELDARKRELPSMLGELVNVAASELGSRVIHYDGIEGVRQITRNSVEASSSFRIFELSNMAAFFDREEAESIRRQFVEKNISTRQISNTKRIDAWTDVTEQVMRLWECRYIDPDALHFEYEILIYDDIYAAYSYNEHDVFGIEVHSASLARTQARLFDFVWANATPMRKVGNRGEARVVARR